MHELVCGPVLLCACLCIHLCVSVCIHINGLYNSSIGLQESAACF